MGSLARRVLPWLVLVGAACSSSGGDEVAGPDGGGGGGGGGVPACPALAAVSGEVAEHLLAVQQGTCAKMFECCGPGEIDELFSELFPAGAPFDTEEECVACLFAGAAGLAAIYEDGLAAGRITMDAAAAADCQRQLEGMTCDHFAGDFGETDFLPCPPVFAATGEAGEPCASAFECRIFVCQEGTCASGAEGAPCALGSICDPGLYCLDGTCAVPLAENASCEGGTSRCAEGLLCRASAPGESMLCLPPGGAGAFCNGDSFLCDAGHWCDRDAGDTCVPRSGDGDGCSNDRFNCAAGLRCHADPAVPVNGTCGPPRAEGESCFEYDDCDYGSRLECQGGACTTVDPGGRTCDGP